MAFSARMKEIAMETFKVYFGVQISVSCASTASLYVAINNDVDIDAVFRKFSISSPIPGPATRDRDETLRDAAIMERPPPSRTMELVESSGGPLTLARLYNKELSPVRFFITVMLARSILRVLCRRGIIKI
ncbi:unnamed protein product [Urochloa humidicola]